MNNDSFRSVLEKAKANDEQALAQLMGQFGYIVDDVCRKVTLPAADMSQSDLRQECWLQVWDKLDKFECTEADAVAPKMFAGWVRTVSRNILIDIVAHRTAKDPGMRHSEHVLVDVKVGDPTPSTKLINEEDVSKIRTAINSLDEPFSIEIINLFFMRNQSLREIARIKGLNYDRVRYSFAKAIRQLEAKLFRSLDS